MIEVPIVIAIVIIGVIVTVLIDRIDRILGNAGNASIFDNSSKTGKTMPRISNVNWNG
jgi:hypothetical protein